MPAHHDQSIGDEITPERVRELADQGYGRNAIMRLTGATQWKVDRAAEAAGVTWDTRRTRKAVETLQVDAAIEREQLAGDFRQIARVILSKVIGSDPGEFDPASLRDLMWTAGSAAASDARYGRLSLDRQRHAQVIDQDSEAKEQFGELLRTLRGGFRTLEDEDEEELQAQVEQADAEFFATLDDDQDDED